MKMIEKAIAYITHQNRLLVFSQNGSPEAGIQVPGGTLEPDEQPAHAVMREAEEETGLNGFDLVAYLGTSDHDARPWGRDEIHRRYFFHLRYEQAPPETWIHYEPDPSIKGVKLFPCKFYWVSMPDEVPELIGERGAFLHHLFQSN